MKILLAILVPVDTSNDNIHSDKKDVISSRSATVAYRDNFDNIFGKKKENSSKEMN